MASGRELARFHPPYVGGVTCFAWAPDDSVIAQCDAKDFNQANPPAEVDTWDPRSGRLLHSAHSGELIGTVAFSPDSRRFVYTRSSRPRDPARGARWARTTSSPEHYPVAATAYDARTGGALAQMSPSAPGSAPVAGALDPAGNRLLTAGARAI